MNNNQWDKLAKKYHDEVVSPFYGNVDNPLIDELNNELNKDKSVAELGCGLFYLVKTLSKQFKQVHGSDFSVAMVNLAKKNSKNLSNVDIKQEDMININYKEEFDTIISVNSLIMPSVNDITKSLLNIHNALKKDGNLLLILPAMESVLYHGMLIYNNELKKRKESVAKRTAKTIFENNKYDLFLGYYKDGAETQKFYYEHEIKFLLKKTGFKYIKIKRVLYPWDKGVSDYEIFPKEERLWDWFVKVKK
jgi:SAM-dependent methyltransferase